MGGVHNAHTRGAGLPPISCDHCKSNEADLYIATTSVHGLPDVSAYLCADCLIYAVEMAITLADSVTFADAMAEHLTHNGGAIRRIIRERLDGQLDIPW